MRKTMPIVTLVAFAGVAGAFAERGMVETTFDGKKISIEYGRPLLAGRDMLSQLPDGGVWRMGMDAGTMLTTEIGLRWGDLTLAPGGYRLWARKNSSDDWQLLINSSPGSYNESNNVAVVPLTIGSIDSPVETFTIALTQNEKGGKLMMSWATTTLKAKFTAEE